MTHATRRLSAAALGALALVLVPGAAGAQPPDVAAAAGREAQLVQFYGGGGALSAAERAALDAAVRQAFAADPKGAASASDDAGQLLAIIGRQKGPGLALAREMGRQQIAFGGLHALGPGEEGRAAGRIVAAHDPVVAAEPASQQLVTMQTVKALGEGVRQGAKVFDITDAGLENETALAQSVREGWSGMDAGIRDAVAHAGRDMPYAVAYLNQGAAARRTALIADWRAKILATPDVEGHRFRLAEVMAFTGATGFKNRASLAGGPDAARNMQAAQDRAGRALMPGCGVAAGSVMSPEKRSFCQPSPLP